MCSCSRCSYFTERVSGGSWDKVRAGAGASWVGFSAAAEADDGGVLSKRGEVEYTKEGRGAEHLHHFHQRRFSQSPGRFEGDWE